MFSVNCHLQLDSEIMWICDVDFRQHKINSDINHWITESSTCLCCFFLIWYLGWITSFVSMQVNVYSYIIQDFVVTLTMKKEMLFILQSLHQLNILSEILCLSLFQETNLSFSYWRTERRKYFYYCFCFHTLRRQFKYLIFVYSIIWFSLTLWNNWI